MKKSAKNKTPREYISWSQLSLWERDPEEYRRVYVEGQEQFVSDAMILGKQLAEAMEDDIVSDIPIIEQGRMFLPHYENREFEIRVNLRVGKHDIPLFGKLDGYEKKDRIIGEIKTGATKWTQRMVDQHGQLTFYALLVYLRFKKMPSSIRLHWLNTDEESENYGMVKSFETKRSLAELIKMHTRINNAWAAIIKLSNGKL